MKKKKPDMVVDNPGLMPYGTNLGAPSIIPNDIDAWKASKVIDSNNYFQSKFEELKNEYKKLTETVMWNEVIYRAKYQFEPVIGHSYFLYESEHGDFFLSLISPNEWKKYKQYLGEFRFDTKNKWEKI